MAALIILAIGVWGFLLFGQAEACVKAWSQSRVQVAEAKRDEAKANLERETLTFERAKWEAEQHDKTIA